MNRFSRCSTGARPRVRRGDRFGRAEDGSEVPSGGLGLHGRPWAGGVLPAPAGDEAPPPGTEDKDWLVLRNPDGGAQLAFQQGDRLEEASWPDAEPVPRQLHLDLTVDSVEELEAQHTRVLELGGRLRYDRSEDPEEPMRVYADPAGHPFCVFVA